MTTERFRLIEKNMIAFGMRQFLRISELSTYGQAHFDRVVLPAMIAGEKRWPSWDAQGLLEGYNVEVSGLEQVPQQDLGLVIINHCKGGPLRGWWPDYWVDLLSARVTGKDVRWVLQDALETKIFGKKLGIEVPLFSQMQRIFIETYQLFSAPAGFRKSRQVKPPIEMIKAFKRGDILGLASDKKAGSQEANFLTARLANHLSRVRPEAMVLPIVASGRDKELFLNIGKPKRLLNIISNDINKTANNLLREINYTRSSLVVKRTE